MARSWNQAVRPWCSVRDACRVVVCGKLAELIQIVHYRRAPATLDLSKYALSLAGKIKKRILAWNYIQVTKND